MFITRQSAPLANHIYSSRFIHAPIAFYAQLQFFVHFAFVVRSILFLRANFIKNKTCYVVSFFLVHLIASLPVGIPFSVVFFVIFSGFHLFNDSPALASTAARKNFSSRKERGLFWPKIPSTGLTTRIFHSTIRT